MYVGKKKSSNSSITSIQFYNAKGKGGGRESSFSLRIEMSWGKGFKNTEKLTQGIELYFALKFLKTLSLIHA